MRSSRKCYLCGRPVTVNAFKCDTGEDQWVYVGSECRKLVTEQGVKAGPFGPTIRPMTDERWAYFVERGMDRA